MYEYKVKLIRAIDGDTVECLVDLGFSITVKERFRLLGINAPEIRTKDPEEKKLGLRATSFVDNYFDQYPDTMIVKVSGKDKYGRWLATFYPEHATRTLNEILVEAGLAEVYS